MTVSSFVLFSAILSQIPASSGPTDAPMVRGESETESLVRPRTLTLDYRDTPMSEVIKEITAKTGCRVTINETMTE